MGETADQLRQEIDQTRSDATSKIQQIEAKVEETTQQVKTTIDDTKDQVKSTIDDTKQQVKTTIEETKQQVKGAFDVRKQVEERPLVAVGAALVGGFVLGGMIGGGDDKDDHRRSYPHRVEGQYVAGGGMRASSSGGEGGMMQTIKDAAKKSGLEETLTGVAATAMGSFTDRIKQMAEQAFPGSTSSGGKSDGKNEMSSSGSAYGGQSIAMPSSIPSPTIPSRTDAETPAGASYT